jgi:Bacterial Ig domain
MPWLIQGYGASSERKEASMKPWRGMLWLLLSIALVGLPAPVAAQTCLFRWDPAVAADAPLAGYRLYSRMTQTSPYDWAMPTEDLLLEDLADPDAPERQAMCEAGQYWVVTVYDMENHASGPSNEVRVPLSADTTPPVVTITSPTSGTTWNIQKARLTMSGTAQDTGGVTTVRWQTSQGKQGTASGTTSWSTKVPIPSGTTDVTIEALDAAGNVGSDMLRVTR